MNAYHGCILKIIWYNIFFNLFVILSMLFNFKLSVFSHCIFLSIPTLVSTWCESLHYDLRYENSICVCLVLLFL